MPGQKILEADRSAINPKFICTKCEMLLVEPMQLILCGHLMCRDCVHTTLGTLNPVCPMDGTELKQLEEIVPDNFTKRQLWALHLQCPNSGCDWSGTYKELLQDHSNRCRHSLIKCVNGQCKEEFKRSFLVQHFNEECNYRLVKCTYCKEKLPLISLQEHVYVHCLAVTVTCEHCGLGNIPRREFNKHGMECDETPVDCDFKAVGCTHPKVAKRKDLHQHYSEVLIGHVVLLLFFVLKMFAKIISIPAMESELSNLKKSFEKFETKHKKLENELRENALLIERLRVRLDQIDHSMALTTVKSDVETTNQGQAATSYNGTLIWKIDGFIRKRQDAVNRVQTAMYSPYFYSGQFGYKMCARIYLNGDGFGKGTHVSLFFVVMKGEYDSLLPWPFQKKITMMLMDQNNGNHMMDAFRSDPQSSSFQRPKSDMNIVSGSPLFVPLDGLANHGFVKDDTMFIKIMVD